MEEVLRRKRAAEQGETPEDIRAKRREEILKKIEERKKQQKEVNDSKLKDTGTGSPTTTANSSDLSRIIFLHEQKIYSLETQLKQANSDKEFEIHQIKTGNQREITRLNALVENLQKNLKETEDNKENEISQLNGKLIKLQNDISEIKLQNSELNGKVDNLNEENSKMREKNQKNVENRTDSFMNEKQELEEKIKKIETEKNLINLEKNEMKLKYQNLQNENNFKDNQIEKLNEKIKKLENQIKTQEAKQQEENSALNDKIGLLEKQIKNLEEKKLEENKKNEEIIKKQENKIKSLEKEKEEINKLFEDQEGLYMEEKQLSDAQIEFLKNKINKIKEINKKLKVKIFTYRENFKTLKNQGKIPEKSLNPKKFAAELISEVNLLRSNPSLYSKQLESIKFTDLLYEIPTSDGSPITVQSKEGQAVLLDAICYLDQLSPLPPLQLLDSLCASSQLLCDTNGPLGLINSDSPSGAPLSDRLNKFGKWKGKVMELLNFGPQSNNAKYVVIQWLIDDGNSSRLQRKTLLDPEFTVAGVGFGVHKKLDSMAALVVAKKFEPNEAQPATVIQPSSDEEAEVVICECSLDPNPSAESNRLKLQAEQKQGLITFSLFPCACKVDVTVKLLPNKSLCLDSYYLEVNQDKTTKTVNRREKINLPFPVVASNVSCIPCSNGFQILVKK